MVSAVWLFFPYPFSKQIHLVVQVLLYKYFGGDTATCCGQPISRIVAGGCLREGVSPVGKSVTGPTRLGLWIETGPTRIMSPNV